MDSVVYKFQHGVSLMKFLMLLNRAKFKSKATNYEDFKMLPKEIFKLKNIGNWDRQRFVTRSQNCMNRALLDIRRIGKLGERYLFSDNDAEIMIAVLRKEIDRAEVNLQERQPPAFSDDDEFTWEKDNDKF